MSRPPTDYELDLLLESCPRETRPYLVSLLSELRELREMVHERMQSFEMSPDEGG